MINKIKKNLIHFNSHGNITEDFVASRREKVRKLRCVTRACFYAHCAGAILCFVISFLLAIGGAVILLTAFALTLAWLAFFAMGNSLGAKIALFTLDFALGAGLITWGAVHTGGGVFIVCGAIIAATGLMGVVSYIAALCKRYLEEFRPANIRRTDYTLYPDHQYALITELVPNNSQNPDISEKRAEEAPSLPPLTSDLRLLANKLQEIICDNKN